MTKSEIVSSIAENVKMTKSDVETVLDAFLVQITQSLQDCQPVRLIGFGTFAPRLRKQFKARNPKTGACVDVAPVYVPSFKSGKTLRMALASIPVEA
jgi:DNA-binding protein HU-beta